MYTSCSSLMAIDVELLARFFFNNGHLIYTGIALLFLGIICINAIKINDVGFVENSITFSARGPSLYVRI